MRASRRLIGIPSKAHIGWLTLVAVCLFGFTWAWLSSPHRRDRLIAADILQHLRTLPEALGCERDGPERTVQLRRLAREIPAVTLELFRRLPLSKRDYELPLCPHEIDELINIGLGIDRDGSRSRDIADVFLLPALRTREPLPSALPRKMLQSQRLHLDPKTARLLYDAELHRIENNLGPEMALRYRRPSYPTLVRVGRQLDAEGAHGFVPRLVAQMRRMDGSIPGTLAALSALLSADDLFTAAQAMISVGLDEDGLGSLASLAERLTPEQVTSLMPSVLERIAQQPAVRSRNEEDVRAFLSRGRVVEAFAAKTAFTDRARLGHAAIKMLAAEKSDLKLPALAIVLLPLLEALDHGQVAAALRPVLDLLPSPDMFVHAYYGDKTARLLAKADPGDVSSAAHRMLERLVDNAAKGQISSNLCETLGSWAPALSAADAFHASRALAIEMVKPRPAHVVTAFGAALDGLSTRLHSDQALAVAQILAGRLSLADLLDDHPGEQLGELQRQLAHNFDEWVPKRLEHCVLLFARRMDPPDLRALQRVLRFRIATEKHAPTRAWLKELLPSLSRPPALAVISDNDAIGKERDEHIAEVVAEILNGMSPPSPGGDISPYVDAMLTALPKLRYPAQRGAVVERIARVTATWRKLLTLHLYMRSVPAQQLYLDLLKDFSTSAESWTLLVRALLEHSPGPVGKDLWDYLAWTKGSKEGRALALDWDSPPPWLPVRF